MPIKKCIEKNIDKSLLRLLSVYDSDGLFDEGSINSNSSIASLANIICKYAALFCHNLIIHQGFLLNSLNEQKLKTTKDYNEIKRIVDIIYQIWAGHYTFNTGMAMNTLIELSSIDEKSIFGIKLAENNNIFEIWQSFFDYKKKDHTFTLKSEKFKNFDYQLNICKLIESLPILKQIEIDYDSKVFSYKNFEQKYNFSPFIFTDIDYPIYPYFIIYDLKISTEKKIIKYQNVVDNHIFFEENYSNRDDLNCILNLMGISLSSIKESPIYLFGDNYVYIKNLSKAFVEILDTESKDGLFQEFRVEADDFNSLASEENKFCIILSTYGYFQVFDFIFAKKGTDIYKDFFSFFERNNLGKKNNWINLIKESKAEQEKLINNSIISIIYGTNNCFQKKYESKHKLNKNTEKEIIISVIIKAAGKRSSFRSDFSDAFPLKKQLFIELYNSYKDINSPTSLLDFMGSANKLLEQVYHFVISFCYGLSGYYIEKMNSTDFSEDRCENAFLNAFSEKLNRLKTVSSETKGKFTYGKLIEEFRKLPENNVIKALTKDMFGREALFDYDKFNKLTKDISAINETKHCWLSNKTKVDFDVDEAKKAIDEFYKNTILTFNILQDKSNYLNTIYPLVISFKEQSYKRGGIVFHQYFVKQITEEDEKEEIRILTPNEYSLNDDYYCIPNKATSLNSLWIEPFLIKSKRINQLFFDINYKNEE